MIRPPTSNSPKKHIARIRQRKFGLAPDGSLIKNPLSDDLQRAINHLSEGLYTKETHFILELIQNAEDNQYGSRDRPDLAFILLRQDPSGTPKARGALLVVNNELGFKADDVDALCAVGKTTKNKREGYIGEKGIGFKSVFVVSHRPHIFSGGYRFCFQEDPDPQVDLGYIVPYWIPQIYSQVEEHADRTCILLPLKPDKWTQVAQELETIAPETILFLSKLEGLTVKIGEEDPIEVIRDDSQAPLVELLKGEDYAEYWNVHQEFVVPDDLGEEKREGITIRQVSVALPLTQTKASDLKVFAFLPTGVQSGFPFLVNADFLLSTSREAIQVDRPWNLWLRDCITPVFCQAFTSLLEHPKYRPKAYSFIPLIENVQEEFLKVVAEAIYQDLSDERVVWTFAGDMLVRPSEARLAPKSFRQLLSDRDIPSQLEKTPLVHSSIQTFHAQLKAIGVKDLSPDEIITCLEDDNWLSLQRPEWFAKLYAYLTEYKWATEKRLSRLKLLPLNSGERTSVSDHPVFFPFEPPEKADSLLEQIPAAFPLAFLHMDLFEVLSGNLELVSWVQKTLGVRKLEPDKLCLDIARWLHNHYKEIAVSDLIQLTAYIRDQFGDLKRDVRKELVDLLPVALNDGTIIEGQSWSQNQPLVVPETLDPQAGWQVAFPDPEDRKHMQILTEDYLAHCDGEVEHKAWSRLFEAIGASDAPYPRDQEWRFWSVDLPENIPTRAKNFIMAEWKRSTAGYRFHDRCAPQWLRELTSTGNCEGEIRKLSQALLKWVQSHVVRSRYDRERIQTAYYKWHYYTWRKKELESEFFHCLLNAPWFPTTQGFKRPGEVFVDRPELRELFGDSVPYSPPDLNSKTAEWLGLRTTSTVEELLQYLRQISSCPAAQADRNVVEKVYSFLSERWQTDISGQFAESPLILASRSKPRWVTTKQAVWPDLSAVFGETYAYLEREYGRQLQDFFIEKVGVADRLSPELYAQALIHLAEGDGSTANTVEAALEGIYPELLKIIKSDERPSWWQEFCDQARIWTLSDQFVDPEEVFVPDDGILKQIFSEKGIEFAWRPEKSGFADYKLLYHELGVRSLRETVEEKADIGSITDTDSESFLTIPAKRAICAYLWNMRRDAYEQSKQTGVLEALLRTKERTVTLLEVRYSVGSTRTKKNACAHWTPDESILYKSSIHSPDQLEIDIPAIVARRFCQGRTSIDLESFIGRVLGASEIKAKGIIRKNNWYLPTEENEWVECTLNLSGPLPNEVRQADVGSIEPEISSEDAMRRILRTEESARTPPEVGPREALKGRKRRSKTGSAQPSRGRSRDTGRLRTYVSPAYPDRPINEKNDSEATSEHSKVDRAGIHRVIEYEIVHGRIPTEMSHHNPGYDVESLDAQDQVRYIEVKSLSGDWDGRNAAGLTDVQFTFGQEKGDQFWLYVVERAKEDDYRIHCIQDPANKVNQFLFDDGWEALADTYVAGEEPAT